MEPTKKGTSNLTGVRYISEDLIKKITKLEHLEAVTTLNLTLSREVGKKIKFIEHLEKLKRLHTLNLSFNIVEKIEKLDKLVRLRDLNLSYNKLSRIENLETLTQLQHLNLSGNLIEHVPAWLGKKLKALRVLKLAKNQLQSLQELNKLRPLKDLTELTVAENPVTQLRHCRTYLIFHLRSVENLDGQAVDWEQRSAAQARFGQEELELLEQQVEQENQRYQKLQDQHNRSLGELELTGQRLQKNATRVKSDEKRIKNLESELETKNDLLKRKTSELTKACEKHYELEQELAFYKLDHKFDTLSRPITHETGLNDSDDAEGLVGGESPYIGKGRFKMNEYARQQYLQRGQAVPAEMSLYIDNVDGTEERKQEHTEVINKMDKELEDKHNDIETAQQRLQHLHYELETTQSQLCKATDELERLAVQSSPDRHLTEDDKQHLRSELAHKISKVHALKGAAGKIESEMNRTQEEIKLQHQEIGQLRGKLRRMGSKDSLYTPTKNAMSEKEEQLQLSQQQYQHLQQQLEGMLMTIAQETRGINKLEQELREGLAVQNTEMKEELEGIISGLQTYLSEVQQKAELQRERCDQLTVEREELAQVLHDTEQEVKLMRAKAIEIPKLKQGLAALEESLQEEREANVSLKHQLKDAHHRESKDAAVATQLTSTKDEMSDVKKQMVELKKKSQDEKDKFEKQLEAERKKFGFLKGKAREADDKEDEIHNLHKQLTALQKSNAGFQDDIYALKEKLKKEEESRVDPEDLRKRLDDVVRSIHTGRPRRGCPAEDEDEVAQALGDLQDHVHEELERSMRDTDHATRAMQNAETQVEILKDELALIADKERKRAERAIQTVVEDERQINDRLIGQISKLKEQLEKEREMSKERAALPHHLLQPSSSHDQDTGSETTSATGTTVETVTTSSGESSTVRSSEWSNKKQEMYENMNEEEQELFDELQEEIDALRELLAMKNKGKEAVKKAAEVQTMTEKLQDMLTRRQSSGMGTSNPSSYSKRSQTLSSGSSAYSSKHSSKSSDKKQTKKNPVFATKMGKFGQVDPRLQGTADELVRAQDEIELLQALVRDKNVKLQKHRQRSESSENTAAARQDEIDDMVELLQDQKEEIHRLNDVLAMAHGVDPELYREYQNQVQDVRRGTASIRSRLHELGPAYQRQQPGPGDQAAYMAGPGHPYGDVAGYEGNPRPQGRPTPTFYGPDGRPLAPEIEDEYLGAASSNFNGMPDQYGHDQISPFKSAHGHPLTLQDMQGDMGPGPSIGNFIAGMDNPGMSNQGMGAQGINAPIMGFQGRGGHGAMGSGMTAVAPPFREDPTFGSHNTMGVDLGAQGINTGLHSMGVGAGVNMNRAAGMGQSAPAFGASNIGSQMFAGNGQQQGGPLPNNALMPMGQSVSGAPVPAFGQGQPQTTGPQAFNLIGQTSGAGGEVFNGSMPAGTNGYYGAPTAGLPGAAHVPMTSLGQGVVPAHTFTGTQFPNQMAPSAQVITLPQGVQLSAPTTPIAGSAVGAALSATPLGAGIHPMMMSTPMTPGTEGALRGILKKERADLAEDLDDQLHCNVPEHHDLEDYVDTLQAKIRTLKCRLGQKMEDSDSEENRRVLFEDDVERNAVRRLQAELHERRNELEGLDLAIENQKSQLDQMRRAEKSLLSERDAAKRELESLRSKPSGEDRRRAFLNGSGNYTAGDDDMDYEYSPRYNKSRKNYVQDEIHCLEQTLGKRRAELREADHLLQDCRLDLLDARNEAKKTIHNFDTARGGLLKTANDAGELEGRANEAARILIATEDRVAKELEKAKEVTAARKKQQEMLQQIQQVITAKDAEFISLDKKSKEAKQVLEQLEGQLSTAEGQQKERLLLMQQSDEVVANTRAELATVSQQVLSQREELQDMEQEISRKQAELESLQSTMSRRETQLTSLDRDVEMEVTNKRSEIKKVERDLSDLKSEKRKLEHAVKSLSMEAKQAHSSVERQEDSLKHILDQVSHQTAQVDEVRVDLQQKEIKLKQLELQQEEKLAQLEEFTTDILKEEHRLNRLQSESSRRSAEVEQMTHQYEQRKEQIDDMSEQHRHLDLAVSQHRREKAELERSNKSLQKKLSDMKRMESELKSSVENDHHLLSTLDSQLRKLGQLMYKAHRGRRPRSTSEQQDEQDSEIRSDQPEQRESVHFDDLEDMVRELGQELSERSQQRQHLAQALDHSCEQLKNLQARSAQEKEEWQKSNQSLNQELVDTREALKERKQELQSVRYRASSQVTELQGLAQAHASRAARLSDELSYLRAQYMEISRKVQSQQEIAEREKELNEQLKEIKIDIRTEVAEDIAELEKSHLETTLQLDELQNQKKKVLEKVNTVKADLGDIRNSSGSRNIQDAGNSWMEQQYFLKQQLEQKMCRHTQAMQTQRQISQDSLIKLQKKLSSLENVMLECDVGGSGSQISDVLSANQAPSVSGDSSNITGLEKTLCLQAEKESDPQHLLAGVSAERQKSTRAYSPNRHSYRRAIRTPNSPSQS